MTEIVPVRMSVFYEPVLPVTADLVPYAWYCIKQDGYTDFNLYITDESSNVVGHAQLTGASAYQHWLNEGNTGTVADFLESLVGPVNDTLDKPAYSDTASLKFTTAGILKAELGTIGTDTFTMKAGAGASTQEVFFNYNFSTKVTNFGNNGRVEIGDFKGSKDVYDKIYLADQNPGIRMELSRSYGGFAASLFNIKSWKLSTNEEFSMGQIGLLGGFDGDGSVLGDVDVINYLYFGAGKDTAYNNNAMRLYPNNNAWFAGDVSAATFTDRTPYPKTLELAYECVESMQRLPDGEYDEVNKDHQLDHEKLHPYLAVVKLEAVDDNENIYEDFLEDEFPDGLVFDDSAPMVIEEKVISRDMSATISVQNEVIKDLIKRVKALESA